MRPTRPLTGLGLLAALAAAAGCGTTRMTDTSRSATEMLLVSKAVDEAVARIDFTPLAGRTVFLDATAVDKDTVDKGYLVSLVRQQLLAAGALVQEERHRAVYVVEVRSGAVGTDRNSVLVGTPAVSLPSVVPGMPTSIPEIALVKKNDQRGVAKVGVFAYNRVTGRALWQSGNVQAMSRSKDTWVFGAGPYSQGTIRDQPELAGEPIPKFPLTVFGEHPDHTPTRSGEQFFPTSDVPPPPPALPAGLLGLTGAAAAIDRPLLR